MELNRLDELKELLDSLPNNIDTWNEKRFSMCEETLSRIFGPSVMHLKRPHP